MKTKHNQFMGAEGVGWTQDTRSSSASPGLGRPC